MFFIVHIFQLVNDEAPVMKTEQLFVREGHLAALTNTSLYITDLDTPPRDLLLTLTSEPINGQLLMKKFFEENEEMGTVLNKGDRLTYEVNILLFFCLMPRCNAPH